jgi:catechol 2,3-dioxygenase-like lactoylglutathione lyase family enzyme
MRRVASNVNVTEAGALHPGRPHNLRMREWYVSDDVASDVSCELPWRPREDAAMVTAPAPEPVPDGTRVESDARMVVNHLGQVVTDLERSRRFYVEALGFEPWRELQPPDDSSATLLGLDPPLGMTACYLRLDGLVLELLHFAAPGRTRPPARRTMDEPGLTHLSLSCDIAATCARVVALGGEVLTATDIGAAVFVRDPDGQLIELLPLAYADHLAARDR